MGPVPRILSLILFYNSVISCNLLLGSQKDAKSLQMERVPGVTNDQLLITGRVLKQEFFILRILFLQIFDGGEGF